MASTSSNQETSIQIVTSDTLPIKGKTMKLEDDQLTVQVENPVDFMMRSQSPFLRSDCI